MNEINLNDEQRAAVTTDAPNAVVIAGPGAGKSRTLVARVLELLQRGVPAESIVCISYTNNAADEISERIARHGYRSEVATAALQDEDYEALANEVGKPNQKISYCGTLHGYALRLLERHGSLIGLTSKIVVMDEERAEEAFDAHAEALGGKFTDLHLRTRRQQFLTETVTGERKHGADLVIQSWFANMLTTGAFDFDGILYWAGALIHRGALVSASIPKLNLLVDEAQDMADIDAQFYTALPCVSRFVTGDSDQSIFGFRGGNPRHLVGWFNDMNWMPYVLQGNYRCGEDICLTANSLIMQNQNRVAKHSVSLAGFAGDVETWSGLPTAQHEQKALAEDIRLTSEPKECAVLMRTNALVDEYAKALESYGIPVARRKERERPKDWKLCKAALAALANPQNDALVLWLIEVRDGPEAARKARHSAAALRTTVAEWWAAQTVPKLLATTVDWLVRLGVGPESVSLAKKALDRSSTIADALLLLAQEEHASVTTGEGVTVCTMHAFKGREAETIYLPAFEQEIIPGTRKDVDIEEARRLCYVAFTRAKRRLIISYANERKVQWQDTKPSTPSQFIKESMEL